MGRNARPRRGAASSGPATAAAPPKKSITTKQRASKNTGQKTSAQAGRVSKNIHVPKKKRDEEPDDEEQDEDVPKKKGAPKRKRDEEPDDEEQDEDDEEAGQDDESDSELSVSGDSDEESEDGDDADRPIDLGCVAPTVSAVLLVVAPAVAPAALTSPSAAGVSMVTVSAGCVAPTVSAVLLVVAIAVLLRLRGGSCTCRVSTPLARTCAHVANTASGIVGVARALCERALPFPFLRLPFGFRAACVLSASRCDRSCCRSRCCRHGFYTCTSVATVQ